MRRLDFYVQHMLKQGARSILMRSGQPVEFRFDTDKPRRSNQPISHKQVVQLVREVASPEALDELRRTGRTKFEADAQSSPPVYIAIDATEAEQWRVMISGVEHDELPESRSYAPDESSEQADVWDGGLPPDHEAFGSTTRNIPSLEELARAKQAAPQAQPARVDPQRAARPAPEPARVATSFGLKAPPPLKPAAAPAAAIRAPASAAETRLQRYLRAMVHVRASDLHLSSGAEAIARVDGEIRAMEGAGGPMRPDDLTDMMMSIAPPDVAKQYQEHHDADFAYEVEGLGRFRLNYFVDRRGPCFVARQIPMDVLTPEQLGLPPAVIDMCWLSKGLVLITGPTGSGKSTTLASLIDFINRNRSDHIITIEDPIEYVHPNKRCLVNQRQVGVHTSSFSQALRAALREDPDVIVVGELRDVETISIAVETAETGHLVFGTLHTTTAASTVDRIIDQFPAAEQGHIRSMLAESLRCVVSQVLCKRNNGGRAAAYEVLLATAAAQNLVREGKTFQLKSLMQTGRAQGMQTMNDHLFDLVRSATIDVKDAYMKAYDKHGFREMLQKAGIRLDPNLTRAMD